MSVSVCVWLLVDMDSKDINEKFVECVNRLGGAESKGLFDSLFNFFVLKTVF